MSFEKSFNNDQINIIDPRFIGEVIDEDVFRRLFFILPMHTFDAISRILEILQTAYEEEISDQSIAWDDPVTTSSIIEKSKRKTRFLFRMTTFTIMVCNLEYILNRISEMKELRNEISDDDKTKRKGEIEKWEKMRNKIFAHSSFAKPYDPKIRKCDSESLQETSVAFLSGCLSGGSANRYYLGGSYCKAETDDASVAKGAELEKCGIVDDYESLMSHFKKWGEMIVKVLEVDL